MIKKLIPYSIKIKYQLFKRFFKDYQTKFATKKATINSKFEIKTIQEIKQGQFFENKFHNIQHASKKIESIIIEPQEIFSFWKIIGNTTVKNNYKVGRNIVNGKITEQIGGGICQLSSIIYLTALKANLKIIERHNHSVDIYNEADRFTPLGADSTVVYGYKDLRIKNNLKYPIQFKFEFNNNFITCKLVAQTEIISFEIEFLREYQINGIVKVKTIINGIEQYQSIYKLLIK